jgi:hypothetical protein
MIVSGFRLCGSCRWAAHSSPAITMMRRRQTVSIFAREYLIPEYLPIVKTVVSNRKNYRIEALMPI